MKTEEFEYSSRRRFLAHARNITLAGLGISAFPGSSGLRAENRSVGSPAFFHLRELNRKWFLIGPDEKPYYLRGANHYGDGTYMPLNLNTRYGSQSKWLQSVCDRHREWGFNYLPPSIGPSEHGAKVEPPTITETRGKVNPNPVYRTKELPASDFASMKFPFSVFLEYPKQYMGGRQLPDVWGKAFLGGLDARCREMCLPLKDDPNLIGYHFTQNPPWHPTNTSFEYWITDIVHSGNPAHVEWMHLMKRIYGSIERWNHTYGIPINSWEDILKMRFPLRAYVLESNGQRDRAAFMQLVCEQWYKAHRDAIRRYDPNHLILGDRNTGHLHPLPEYALHIMAKYIDVLSINAMGHSRMFYQTMEQVTPHWKGPIHLADTGAGIYNGEWAKSAYQARDIDEYDELYKSYMTAGLEHPQLIGFGWCGYYETASHRSGLVDSRNDDPLADRIEVISKWNNWMETEYLKKYQELKRL